MIAGLSKAVALYLAPLLCLTSIVLTLLSLLSPSLILHDQVALLTVLPGSMSTAKDVDGPSIFLGVLGSCAQKSNAVKVTCTPSSVSPLYDVSVLPKNAPGALLTAPSGSSAAFLAFSVACMVIFFVTFTLVSFAHKMPGKASATFSSPILQHISAWIGFIGFLVGISTLLIIRMWFGKAIGDFNGIVSLNHGPNLVASAGNGFTMAWVAYAFYAVPVVCSLAKLNLYKGMGK